MSNSVKLTIRISETDMIYRHAKKPELVLQDSKCEKNIKKYI